MPDPSTLFPTERPARFLRAVMAGRGEAVPLRAIYADDDDPPDPERQHSTFKEKLYLMRPVLARVEMGIESAGRGDDYRIVRLVDEGRAAAWIVRGSQRRREFPPLAYPLLTPNSRPDFSDQSIHASA